MTTTREEAIAEAGRLHAAAWVRQSALPARVAAEEAHRPGGPSVQELADRIRQQRLDAGWPSQQAEAGRGC